MEYAQDRFELAKKAPGTDIPIQDHNEVAAEQLAKFGLNHLSPKVSTSVPLPAGTEWLWGVFLRLSRRRNIIAGFGVVEYQPINFSEISAYLSLVGETLDAWELDAIIKLDEEWLKINNTH